MEDIRSIIVERQKHYYNERGYFRFIYDASGQKANEFRAMGNNLLDYRVDDYFSYDSKTVETIISVDPQYITLFKRKWPLLIYICVYAMLDNEVYEYDDSILNLFGDEEKQHAIKAMIRYKLLERI